MSINYQCRCCGSYNTLNLGELPTQKYFAGELLKQSLPKSYLFKCNNCLMQARHPILTQYQYNYLYSKARSDVWSSPTMPLRRDQLLVKKLIMKLCKKGSKVLDVGCYTGDLLTSLPDGYLKYGIEMSHEASNLAKMRDIRIIGNDLYNINTTTKFDVITAIDVIEHTDNPKEFIQKLSLLLETNGKLIISTGNCDNWLWVILKNRFWYTKYLEHISFIGEKWLLNFCVSNNLYVVEKKNFSYTSIKNTILCVNIIKLIFSFFRLNPERFSNASKDHFYFVLSKQL